MIVDLRSDTVTKPTKGMLDAILSAQVGDDVYKEDPTVNALEHKVATMFKKPVALFFPTGTMANQTAIKLHTQPGDQLICDQWAHVFNYEGGGASFNSGVSCRLIEGNRGMITAQQVKNAINPPDFYHSPLTSLVCLENTTNKGGGGCYDLDEIKKIKDVCKQNKLGLHLDGARLFNALVAKNQSPELYGELFDTLSICLSKGLGTPLGSILVGDQKLMEKAIRIRKVLGGGMRQIGFMAAAGLYALENHVERLKDDHRRAYEIGECLKNLSYIKSIEPIETNIVIFNLQPDIDERDFIKHIETKRIKISGMGQNKWRIVTHLDYTEEMHNYVINTLPLIEPRLLKHAI